MNVTGIATIHEALIADETVGVSTIGFATITESFTDLHRFQDGVGVALTVGKLTVTSGGGGGGGSPDTGIDSDSVTTQNLVVTGVSTQNVVNIVNLNNNEAEIGIATITYANITDLRVGGAQTTVGIASFLSDVSVAGNLNVTGDIVYDEVTGRNLNISGVATLSDARITDATIGVATITDAVVGYSSVRDVRVGGALTVNGVSRLNDDLFVDGNLTITGSQSSADFSVGDLTVTGIATINRAEISDAIVEYTNTTDLRVGGASTTVGIASFLF